MSKTTRTIVLYGLVVMALVLLGQRFLDPASESGEIDLTVFEQLVESGSVAEATILERSNAIQGELAPGTTVPDVPTEFRVLYPPSTRDPLPNCYSATMSR